MQCLTLEDGGKDAVDLRTQINLMMETPLSM